MPSTYTLISSNVLSSSAASVTFSAIPATYTDLVVQMSCRDSNNSNGMTFGFNGLTTNQSYIELFGDGSAAYSGSGSSLQGVTENSSFTANTFASCEIYIPNYTSAANKPVSVFGVTENNATSSTIAIRSGLWGNTAVITEINFYPAGNNFVSGSSFYLYGIKNS